MGIVGIVVLVPKLDCWDLQCFHGAWEVENAMEHRMISRQFSPVAPRQNLSYLSGKTIPLLRAPEVVHEHGTTRQKVRPQGSDFILAQAHVPRMLHVKERVLVYCRVRELQDTGVRISLDRGQLLEAVGEIQVRIGIIHPPAQPSPPTPVRIRVVIGFENDPGEGEHVVLEARCISPHGSASAVGVRLASGAKFVLVHH